MINGATLIGGRVAIHSAIAEPASWSQSLPYETNEALAVNTTNGAKTSVMAGLFFIGQRVAVQVSETPTLPAGMDYNVGWPQNPVTGELIVNLTLPVVGYMNGWPVAANGTICAVAA